MSVLNNRSKDEADEGKNVTVKSWDSSNALDDMITSMSGKASSGDVKAAAGDAMPTTVFTSSVAAAGIAAAAAVATTSTTATKPAPIPVTVATPIGTLSVTNAATTGSNDMDGFGDSFDTAMANKKPIVAKKITSGKTSSSVRRLGMPDPLPCTLFICLFMLFSKRFVYAYLP